MRILAGAPCGKDVAQGHRISTMLPEIPCPSTVRNKSFYPPHGLQSLVWLPKIGAPFCKFRSSVGWQVGAANLHKLRFFNCTGSLQGTDVATEDGGPILSNSCSTPWVCPLCLIVVSNPWFLLFGFLVPCFWPLVSGCLFLAFWFWGAHLKAIHVETLVCLCACPLCPLVAGTCLLGFCCVSVSLV